MRVERKREKIMIRFKNLNESLTLIRKLNLCLKSLSFLLIIVLFGFFVGDILKDKIKLLPFDCSAEGSEVLKHSF